MRGEEHTVARVRPHDHVSYPRSIVHRRQAHYFTFSALADSESCPSVCQSRCNRSRCEKKGLLREKKENCSIHSGTQSIHPLVHPLRPTGPRSSRMLRVQAVRAHERTRINKDAETISHVSRRVFVRYCTALRAFWLVVQSVVKNSVVLYTRLRRLSYSLFVYTGVFTNAARSAPRARPRWPPGASACGTLRPRALEQQESPTDRHQIIKGAHSTKPMRNEDRPSYSPNDAKQDMR